MWDWVPGNTVVLSEGGQGGEWGGVGVGIGWGGGGWGRGKDGIVINVIAPCGWVWILE